jgi:hypothetical protein
MAVGNPFGIAAPILPDPGHGSWYYAVQVTTVGGRKARYRRGGFPTQEAAVTARQALLERPAGQTAAGAWTLARWLRYWLTLAEPNLRPSTLHSYRDHIDRYLIPSIGRVTLADLSRRRLQACFDFLARQRTRKETPVAAVTVDRVRAMLPSALNTAIREGLIATNPLAQVRLARPVRPHPVIWTDERVAASPGACNVSDFLTWAARHGHCPHLDVPGTQRRDGTPRCAARDLRPRTCGLGVRFILSYEVSAQYWRVL